MELLEVAVQNNLIKIVRTHFEKPRFDSDPQIYQSINETKYGEIMSTHENVIEFGQRILGLQSSPTDRH